ncbi:MarR family winged helix-turn-helix transcriptional regulator [Afifella pfennigii]|uniref:MarR family winged helix-turn-helix transcriptional regulator n=1 Tax=Afifella pfennigii TaxID=209897 RepID=UPI00047B4630|nr:MarR family transcriptional regulator [Afifella pfennigii]
MSFDKTRSAGYLTNHLARLFARRIQARIKPLGLTPGTFPAMLELWTQDGLSQGELVRRLDIEQATMANTLARMERDGLIRRLQDAQDARVQRVWLTERGKALQNAAVEQAAAVNDEALAGLSASERQELIRLMNKLVGELRR